jgi:hypothetical protein
MDLKSDLNNQESIQKQKPPNNNILDDNTTSEVHSMNKIFSNANSIIGLNVNLIFLYNKK